MKPAAEYLAVLKRVLKEIDDRRLICLPNHLL